MIIKYFAYVSSNCGFNESSSSKLTIVMEYKYVQMSECVTPTSCQVTFFWFSLLSFLI